MGQYGFEHVAKESIGSLHWHSSRTVFPTFSSNSQKQLPPSKNLFIDTKLATFGHLQCYILNPIDFFHESALKFILRVGNTDQGSTLWIVGGEDGDFAHNTSEFLTLNDSVPLPGQCCQLLTAEFSIQFYTTPVQKFPKNEQSGFFIITL